MCVEIRCQHKGENDYVFTVSDLSRDIEEQGFEFDVWCKANVWREPETRHEPENSGFKIDYDSFDLMLKSHSDEEKKRITAWVEIHKAKGVFEDAFGTTLYEIESDFEYQIVELLLPYCSLNRNVDEEYKDKDSIYECARWVLKQFKNKGQIECDLFKIGQELEQKWLRWVDFELLKKLEEIKQSI